MTEYINMPDVTHKIITVGRAEWDSRDPLGQRWVYLYGPDDLSRPWLQLALSFDPEPHQDVALIFPGLGKIIAVDRAKPNPERNP